MIGALVRMGRGAALAGAAALALGMPAPASAQDAPPAVTYRQNVMQAIRTNVAQLRAVAEVGHPTHTVHYARALYGLGEILGDAFRNGSAEGSGALPAVWQNHAQFEERVAAFRTATAHLLEAAEMRNQSAIQQAVQEVGGTCGACHQVFRARTN